MLNSNAAENLLSVRRLSAHFTSAMNQNCTKTGCSSVYRLHLRGLSADQKIACQHPVWKSSALVSQQRHAFQEPRGDCSLGVLQHAFV